MQAHCEDKVWGTEAGLEGFEGCSGPIFFGFKTTLKSNPEPEPGAHCNLDH